MAEQPTQQSAPQAYFAVPYSQVMARPPSDGSGAVSSAAAVSAHAATSVAQLPTWSYTNAGLTSCGDAVGAYAVSAALPAATARFHGYDVPGAPACVQTGRRAEPRHNGEGSAVESVRITLANARLWRRFSAHANEMIVSKKGRCMFPHPRMRISGLDQQGLYTIALDVVPASSDRFKFHNGQWIACGKAENRVAANLYIHGDSPNSGAHWMAQDIEFNDARLTNNDNADGHLVLTTFRKYQLRLHVIRIRDIVHEPSIIKTVSFPETTFIAVTSYMNSAIKQLKILHNPFARAFKEHAYDEHRSSDGVSGESADAGTPSASAALRGALSSVRDGSAGRADDGNGTDDDDDGDGEASSATSGSAVGIAGHHGNASSRNGLDRAANGGRFDGDGAGGTAPADEGARSCGPAPSRASLTVPSVTTAVMFGLSSASSASSASSSSAPTERRPALVRDLQAAAAATAQATGHAGRSGDATGSAVASAAPRAGGADGAWPACMPNVLIVEEDTQWRALFQAVCVELQCAVSVCLDVGKAFALLDARRHLAPPYDVLLLSATVEDPVARALVQQARCVQQVRPLSVVVSTTEATAAAVETFIAEGCTDVVLKPLGAALARLSVASCIERVRTRVQLAQLRDAA